MKTLAAVDVERSFEITYDEEDIEDAVQAMEFIKRTRDKVEDRIVERPTKIRK